LQHLHHRLLDESIQHRRNAELSHSPVRLRDLYPWPLAQRNGHLILDKIDHAAALLVNRLRLIRPAQQLFPDRWPLLFQLLRQLLDGHSVHTGASFVGLDSCQCLPAVFPLADFLHQLFADGPAFCPALPPEPFGPFPEAIRGFTPPLLSEGQQ
jgi:hypothetical protein